jgi:hypothetical protein
VTYLGRRCSGGEDSSGVSAPCCCIITQLYDDDVLVLQTRA